MAGPEDLPPPHGERHTATNQKYAVTVEKPSSTQRSAVRARRASLRRECSFDVGFDVFNSNTIHDETRGSTEDTNDGGGREGRVALQDVQVHTISSFRRLAHCLEIECGIVV
jgi:hypothetical protein